MTERTTEELEAAAVDADKLTVTFTLTDDAIQVGFVVGEEGQVIRSKDFFGGPLGQIMQMIMLIMGEPSSAKASFVDARTGESQSLDLLGNTMEEKLNA